ncbi:MAG: septal ring lytic transglycosylase RlpA family protein [Candidatus Omnitrophica bacterium]|nr:septal ring lytic transglycosylase RlpA family protein [Candidatus Omnitrophota bacterium]
MKSVAILLAVMFLATFAYVADVGSSSLIYKGMASWYSEEDPGVLKTTANMECFDDTLLTCAMWDVPFNTILKVTNLENGKAVFVRVNDRGPAKRLVREGRIIDLTKRAFSKIADLENGLVNIKVETI